MILAACATEIEMQSLLDQVTPDQENWLPLLTGVGVVETTLSLTRFLQQHQEKIESVVHFGIGGLYLSAQTDGINLLDICFAEQEFLGDSGICYPDRIEALSEELQQKNCFLLDSELLQKAGEILTAANVSYHTGNFVTVCGVSATAERGTMLGGQYKAICENMEGAAMARVCDEFHVPLLELRAISNFVEDRNVKNWKMKEACVGAGLAAAQIVNHFIKQ